MTDLTLRKTQLPAKIEDLVEYILVGKQVLNAQKAKLQAITVLEKGLAAKEAALEDTQILAEILLYAEAKLGGILEKTEFTKGGRGKTGSSGGTSLQDINIDKKQSHYAQELSRHEDVIAEIVTKARKTGEIPLRQQVLRQIQANKPKPDTPSLPKGKFNVIYADPPWKYDNTGFDISANKQYQTMSIEELINLPIAELAPANAVLFMWVTNPLLQECFPVVESWGFEYKTNFCWYKKGSHLPGFYVYGQHELLLICTKGTMPVNGEKHEGVIVLPSSKHSKKPAVFYEIIEKMYPKGKYVELFAREKRKNWMAWGLES